MICPPLALERAEFHRIRRLRATQKTHVRPVDLALTLNPKKLSRDEPLDCWYPYYAGFSLQFARRIISQATIPRGGLILDPWVGSGTTACAASLSGHRSIGIDLNPFAILLTRAKLTSRHRGPILVGRAAEITRRAERCQVTPDNDDCLSDWLTAAAANAFRAVREEIVGSEQRHHLQDIDAETSFLLVALIDALRGLVARDRVSNPTWTKVGVRPGVRRKAVFEAFRTCVAKLASQLELNEGDGDAHQIILGDSRNLPVRDKSINLVLGSPPYCTRIDYAVTTRLELALLVKDSAEFAHLRQTMMGTTTIRAPWTTTIPAAWPDSLGSVLRKIQVHPSHRSEGYYFRNLLQYFSDATASIAELARVLKAPGHAYLVLQTSYYKDVLIDLPELFCEIARSVGLDARTFCSVPVGRVMATVNSRARRYVDTRTYHESVILLSTR